MDLGIVNGLEGSARDVSGLLQTTHQIGYLSLWIHNLKGAGIQEEGWKRGNRHLHFVRMLHILCCVCQLTLIKMHSGMEMHTLSPTHLIVPTSS